MNIGTIFLSGKRQWLEGHQGSARLKDPANLRHILCSRGLSRHSGGGGGGGGSDCVNGRFGKRRPSYGIPPCSQHNHRKASVSL